MYIKNRITDSFTCDAGELALIIAYYKCVSLAA